LSVNRTDGNRTKCTKPELVELPNRTKSEHQVGQERTEPDKLPATVPQTK